MKFDPNKLKGLRQSKALTQHDLGLKAGIHKQQISEYETKRAPGAKNLSKLAGALNVNPGYFFA